jgi:AraC-like DNA-binding protein
MSALQFSTEPFAVDQCSTVWAHGLRQLGLTQICPRSDVDAVHGTIGSVISGTGARCARIACGAHSLACRMAGTIGDLWLILPLDGVANIAHGSMRFRVPVGEIAFGAMDMETAFTCSGGSRLLFACLPRAALDGGLGYPSLSGPRILRTSSGIARILATMLREVSDTIDQLEPADLRPVEVACVGFLSVALGHEMNLPLAGAVRMGREAFQRICRIIEQRLGDPGLTLIALAREQGVSSRYLQKLFERADERFGHYIRIRRLERCRADLADPALAGEPVATIGFRWGFTDAAHFSRAFRDQFGVAPRAYRLGTTHRPVSEPVVSRSEIVDSAPVHERIVILRAGNTSGLNK